MQEKIIIDCVDVARCKYYKGKCMEYTHYCQIGCKECTDIGVKLCHYKQTERFKAKIKCLEQENKELMEDNLNLSKENKALTLREELYKADCEASEQENKELKECFEKRGELMCNCAKQRENYRSALEEILENAKFAQCLPCGSGNLEDCLNCDDDTTNNGQFCMEKRIHEIKTKCVEVLQ